MNKKTLALVIGSVILIGIDIAGTGWFVGWRENFWTGIKDVNIHAFTHDIITFSGMAFILVLGSGYYGYLQNLLAIHLREQKVNQLARSGLTFENVPNYKQRIEADTWTLYSLGLSLGFGLLRAVVLLIVFLWLLVTMIHSTHTLIYVAAYVVIATVLSRVIAKPLIKLNYDLQTLATDFRESLCLIKFGELNKLNKVWAQKTKLINLFQALFSQASVIIPYLMLSPAYFSGQISFGVLMAVGSLIGQLISDAGWIIGQQDQINNFYACKKRVKELTQ